MSATAFPPLSTGFSWADPTANVDPTQAFQPSEVTGYQIGVRADGDASHAPGNYAISIPVAGYGTTAESKAAALAASSMLVPGNYWAAIRAVGPVDSNWSAEVPFSIAAPQPVPPPNFSAA